MDSRLFFHSPRVLTLSLLALFMSALACGPLSAPESSDSQPGADSPSDTDTESDSPDEPSEPAGGGGAPSASDPAPDLTTQHGSPAVAPDDLFDQISFGVGGGGPARITACDFIAYQDPALVLELQPVYVANYTVLANLGDTIRLDEFIHPFREDSMHSTESKWLPALCSFDPAVLSDARALAPDGSEYPVFRHGPTPVFEYSAQNGWTEIGQVSGVTLPLEALVISGTWEITSEYNGQTYSFYIDLPSSGDPFMVNEDRTYLARRFAPLERIRAFAMGHEAATGSWIGEFDLQADQNGNVLFNLDLPADKTDSFDDLTLIGEGGHSIVAAGQYYIGGQALEGAAVYDLFYRAAWGQASAGPPSGGGGGGGNSGSASAPTLTNFRFCDGDCLELGSTQVTGYSGYTEDIWVAWDYSGMQAGMRYTREWYSEDDLWIHYDCVWRGSESGSMGAHLFDTDGGLFGGEWTVRIIIEGTHTFSASVNLADSNTFWDPVGTASSCPDF